MATQNTARLLNERFAFWGGLDEDRLARALEIDQAQGFAPLAEGELDRMIHEPEWVKTRSPQAAYVIEDEKDWWFSVCEGQIGLMVEHLTDSKPRGEELMSAAWEDFKRTNYQVVDPDDEAAAILRGDGETRERWTKLIETMETTTRSARR